MSRREILRIEREKIMNLLAKDDNKAKWLTALMDIDDEIEELDKKNANFKINK